MFSELQKDVERARQELERVDDRLDTLDWLEQAVEAGEQKADSSMLEATRAILRRRDVFKSFGDPSDTSTWGEALDQIVQVLQKDSERASSAHRVLESEVRRYLSNERRSKGLRRIRREVVRVRALFQVKKDVLTKALTHIEAGGSPEELRVHSRADLPAKSDKAREYFWALYDITQENPGREWTNLIDVWRAVAERMGARGPRDTDRSAYTIRKVFLNNGWYATDEPVRETAAADLIERITRIGARYD